IQSPALIVTGSSVLITDKGARVATFALMTCVEFLRAGRDPRPVAALLPWAILQPPISRTDGAARCQPASRPHHDGQQHQPRRSQTVSPTATAAAASAVTVANAVAQPLDKARPMRQLWNLRPAPGPQRTVLDDVPTPRDLQAGGSSPSERTSERTRSARLTIGRANARPGAAVRGPGIRRRRWLGLPRSKENQEGGADDAVQDRRRRQVHRWSLRSGKPRNRQPGQPGGHASRSRPQAPAWPGAACSC